MYLLHSVGQNAPWTSFHLIEVGSNELKLRGEATGRRGRERRAETMNHALKKAHHEPKARNQLRQMHIHLSYTYIYLIHTSILYIHLSYTSVLEKAGARGTMRIKEKNRILFICF